MKYILGLFLSLLIFNSCAPYESEAYKILKEGAFTLKNESSLVEFSCDVISLEQLNLLKKDSFVHFVEPEFSPVKSISIFKDNNEDFYVYVYNSKTAYTCFTNTENILDVEQSSIYEQFKQHTKEEAP